MISVDVVLQLIIQNYNVFNYFFYLLNTLTRFVNIDVKSAAECYYVPGRSSARNNLKASRCFHMGQDIFAVATDVLEAFAARTRMSILLYNDLRFTE